MSISFSRAVGALSALVITASCCFFTAISSGSAATAAPYPLDGEVRRVLPLEDGRTLIGGGFLGGVMMLLSDGRRDPDFSPPPFKGIVTSMAVQPDGKFLVGGGDDSLGKAVLVRLLENGHKDPDFDPAGVTNNSLYGGVLSIAVEPAADWRGPFKILVGCLGYTKNGAIFRLDDDGSVDAAYPVDEHVYDVTAIPDGGFLAGGAFTGSLLRVSSNGNVDPRFSLPTSDYVSSVKIQADGKFLVNSSAGVVRLNTDGSTDSSYTPFTKASVSGMALQPDGKLLIAISDTELYRLSSDGSFDREFSYFSPDDYSDGRISDVVVSNNGEKILVAQNWQAHLYAPEHPHRSSITRLNGDGTMDSTFAFRPACFASTSVIWEPSQKWARQAYPLRPQTVKRVNFKVFPTDVRTVQVQWRLKGSKWRTLETVKTNSRGEGQAKIVGRALPKRATYEWRLVVQPSSTALRSVSKKLVFKEHSTRSGKKIHGKLEQQPSPDTTVICK